MRALREALAGRGAERANGHPEGPSAERRPPGSIMVISVVQWILFSTPMRSIEADEVGAAAEEDVLAVVDDFVDAGMQVGGGAAAEVAAALDELHAIAGFGEGAGSAHAGYAAADDGDGAWCVSLRCFVQTDLSGFVLIGEGQKQILRSAYPTNDSRSQGPKHASLRMTPFYSGTPGSG